MSIFFKPQSREGKSAAQLEIGCGRWVPVTIRRKSTISLLAQMGRVEAEAVRSCTYGYIAI